MRWQCWTLFEDTQAKGRRGEEGVAAAEGVAQGPGRGAEAGGGNEKGRTLPMREMLVAPVLTTVGGWAKASSGEDMLAASWKLELLTAPGT